MANTRQSSKRARQTLKRRDANQVTRSATKSALKKAIGLLKSTEKKDEAQSKAAYQNAVKILAKAASKGAIPRGRAARKTSRLTLLAKKNQPSILN